MKRLEMVMIVNDQRKKRLLGSSALAHSHTHTQNHFIPFTFSLITTRTRPFFSIHTHTARALVAYVSRVSDRISIYIWNCCEPRHLGSQVFALSRQGNCCSHTSHNKTHNCILYITAVALLLFYYFQPITVFWNWRKSQLLLSWALIGLHVLCGSISLFAPF